MVSPSFVSCAVIVLVLATLSVEALPPRTLAPGHPCCPSVLKPILTAYSAAPSYCWTVKDRAALKVACQLAPSADRNPHQAQEQKVTRPKKDEDPSAFVSELFEDLRGLKHEAKRETDVSPSFMNELYEDLRGLNEPKKVEEGGARNPRIANYLNKDDDDLFDDLRGIDHASRYYSAEEDFHVDDTPAMKAKYLRKFVPYAQYVYHMNDPDSSYQTPAVSALPAPENTPASIHTKRFFHNRHAANMDSEPNYIFDTFDDGFEADSESEDIPVEKGNNEKRGALKPKAIFEDSWLD